MPELFLVPFHFAAPAASLGRLSGQLAERFESTVSVHPPWFDPESCYDFARGQYHSTKLLRLLISRARSPGARVLGVTSVDLFIPVLTFVFGEAQLDGIGSVVSTHRLDDLVYGLPPRPDRLLERLEKEATHELGHTFGLVHCENQLCVMRSTTSVEEVDLKSSEFCGECRSRIP